MSTCLPVHIHGDVTSNKVYFTDSFLADLRNSGKIIKGFWYEIIDSSLDVNRTCCFSCYDQSMCCSNIRNARIHLANSDIIREDYIVLELTHNFDNDDNTLLLLYKTQENDDYKLGMGFTRINLEIFNYTRNLLFLDFSQITGISAQIELENTRPLFEHTHKYVDTNVCRNKIGSTNSIVNGDYKLYNAKYVLEQIKTNTQCDSIVMSQNSCYTNSNGNITVLPDGRFSKVKNNSNIGSRIFNCYSCESCCNCLYCTNTRCVKCYEVSDTVCRINLEEVWIVANFKLKVLGESLPQTSLICTCGSVKVDTHINALVTNKPTCTSNRDLCYIDLPNTFQFNKKQDVDNTVSNMNCCRDQGQMTICTTTTSTSNLPTITGNICGILKVSNAEGGRD